tara:strand:- start:154 stop:312 length:159 start_codon:yes stop_codon:yes gene_type:complete
MNGNERQALIGYIGSIRHIMKRKDLTPAKKRYAVIDLCGGITDFIMHMDVVE